MEENIPSQQIPKSTQEISQLKEPISPEIIKPSKPWLKFVVLLVGILLIGGGLVFAGMEIQKRQTSKQITSTPEAIATPTPDPTADWKTYTNDKYGFGFKYPNNWSTYDNTQKANSKTMELYLLNVPDKTPWPDNFLGVVKVYKGVGDLTQWFHSEVEFTEAKKQEFINLAKSAGGFSDLVMSDLSQSYKQTTISGFPAIEQTILCHRENCYFMGGPQNSKEYFVKNKDMVVSISFLTMFPDETFPILDKILSTLKFTNGIEKIDTSSWKTYTNSLVKFSLEHPANLEINESKVTETSETTGAPIKQGQVEFKGTEGSLIISFAITNGVPYSAGWGGGCEAENRASVNFLGNQTSVCINGKSLWVLYGQHPQKYSEVSISATFNPPYTTNKDVILQILSTFKFLN